MQVPETTGSSEPTDLMLWADCEFTGLNMEDGHRIIEIGVVVTSWALHELDTYQEFVSYDWQEVEALMSKNPWWDAHAHDKPYMRAGITTGKPMQQIDSELSDLVDAYFRTGKPSLAGNSVGNDKRHIDAQLPNLASRLSYQIIDVSSLKILARQYRGISYEGKSHKHHALEDVRESIDELRFLLTRLGIVDLQTLA